MPLAFWGNGGGDWSSTFASLADGAIEEQRRAAERLDERREAELAARDEEMFARYQAGEVSNEDWLAYIRRRKAATGYDPQQQAAWTKAELEWTERIADDEAQADFERTGNYADYIGYLEGKMRRTKDSDGRLGLTKLIRDLRDGQAQRDFQRGAQRIANKIAVGEATDDDLLRFYRETRRNLRSNSPLFETIQQGIGEISARIKQTRFETSLARIGFLVSSGQITPKEAGVRQIGLLAGSSLMATDPTRYYSLMDAANKMVHSPDPGRLAELDYRLQTGAISPGDYEAQINLIADRLMDYDPETAFKLRSGAVSAVQQMTGSKNLKELADPGRARVGAGGVDFRWVSQMDGSQYAAVNCTMASGAMLAYALGYKGLSGGDLRYLTGDTSGGTNITQLYNALNRAGVDTSGLDLKYGGTFEQFKKQLANGRSSVIVGDNSMIGAGAKASASHNGMHAWLVADYDPKKDAFLVYNSAMGRGDKRSKDGYWVSADTMQAFGFSGRASGSWLAAPRGTAGKQRRAWHVIDVDTPPKRPDTPKSYKGERNPGISGAQRGGLRGSGYEQPVNEETAGALIARRREEIAQTEAILGSDEWDGVEITPEIADEVAADLLDMYDEGADFAKQNGFYEDERFFLNQRGKFVEQAKRINGGRSVELFNTLLRDSSRLVELSQFSTDPDERAGIMAAINARIQAFAAAEGGKLTDSDELNDIDDRAKSAIDLYANMVNAASDPDLTLDQKREVINDAKERIDDIFGGSDGPRVKVDLPPAFNDPDSKSGKSGNGAGQVAANVAGESEDRRALEAGEAVWMVVPVYDAKTKTWVPTQQAVPVTGNTMTRRNPQTDEVEEVLDDKGQPIPEPDLSGFAGVNQTADSIGWTFVSGKGGVKAVMVATYQGEGWDYIEAAGDDPDGKFNKGDILSQQQLNDLPLNKRRTLLANGILVVQNEPQTRMVTPGRMTPDGYEPPRYYVRDNGLGDGDTASGQWYPDQLPTDDVGNAVEGMTNVVGKRDGRFEVEFMQINGMDVPLSGGVDGKQAQDAWNSGKLDWLKILTQDPNRVLRNPAGDDSATVYMPLARKAGAMAGATAAAAWYKARQDEAQRAGQRAADAALAAARQADADQRDAIINRQLFGETRGRNTGEMFGPPASTPPPDILKNLADSFGVRQPKPSPSRGDIPSPVSKERAPTPPPRKTTPVNPVTSRRSLSESLKPKTTKRFIPPSPPRVKAMQTAQANQAAAKAKAAAAAAIAASRSTGGGVFGSGSSRRAY